MSSHTASLHPGRLPLPDHAREKLICAIRMTAQEQGLSQRVTDRYQAWGSAFLCWCLGSSARPVESDQIEPFRRALRDAGTSEEEVQEAMDALAFLFGAVGVSDVLSPELRGAQSTCAGQESETKPAPRARRDALSTLDVGWHDKERVLTAFSCDTSFWDYTDVPKRNGRVGTDRGKTEENGRTNETT